MQSAFYSGCEDAQRNEQGTSDVRRSNNNKMTAIKNNVHEEIKNVHVRRNYEGFHERCSAH